MNIGVLIICTGKYGSFFKQLYDSSELFFLNGHNKTYYVFTDNNIEESNNIKKIQQNFLGWPYDTMKRFHMFNSINDLLIKEDYLFFLNANMKFIKKVGEEVIPTEKNDFLVGVNHPAFYNKEKEYFPYERRETSQLYIPYDKGKYYYQGCFNGGKSEHFLKMSLTLSEKIQIDMDNNITPIWHDESALNWYYENKSPLLLEPSYSYPESWSLPFDKIIIQLDKNKFGGHNFLRKNT